MKKMRGVLQDKVKKTLADSNEQANKGKVKKTVEDSNKNKKHQSRNNHNKDKRIENPQPTYIHGHVGVVMSLRGLVDINIKCI